MDTVRVTAHQAAQMYRELRDVDSTRRRARRSGGQRAARHVAVPPHGLAEEVALQTALMLVQPYVTTGGAMSTDLARLIADLLQDDAPRSVGAASADPALEVTAAATRVLLRASLLVALEQAGTAGTRPRGQELPQQRRPHDDEL